MPDTCDDLMPLFLEEFEERVATIEDLLLSDDNTSEVSMRAVKRELHTLKGNAGAVGFPACSNLCHGLENLLEQTPDRSRLVDQLLDGIQILRGAVGGMAEGRDLGDEARQLLSQLEKRHSPSSVKPATPLVQTNDRDSADDANDASARRTFRVCLAESAGAAAGVRGIFAPYDTRYHSLEPLFEGGIAVLQQTVSDAHLLVVHLADGSQALSELFRMIEDYRSDEGRRGLYGDKRLNIVAIVAGAPDATRRELCFAGIQYVFSSANDKRIPELTDRLFRAAISAHRRVRRTLRFRELDETFATFSDGTRSRVAICNESFTGICMRVLDPSPCEVFAPVAIEVHGVPMPGYVVRLTGRDERGYVTVGCKWGHSPHEGMFQLAPPRRD